MSSARGFSSVSLGDVTSEVTERAGMSAHGLPVYGVDRTEGLTRVAKYQAKSLAKYKRIQAGMFAYNPMRLNIGSIGYCSDAFGEGLISPDYVAFRCRPDALSPEFLNYLIHTDAWTRWTQASGVGSVRVRIYYRELARMPLNLPPLPEQQAIACILGALDDKIELNRRRNRTLEAMARAIFQSWFVDFDPVKAKAAGRRPAGLSPTLVALFPSSFDDSPLGPIPKGWCIATVGDYCAKITDGSHRSPPSVEDGLPMASVKDMTDWGITVNTCRRISESDFASLVANDCRPLSGDVLLAKDGATCLETAFEYRQKDEVVLLSSIAILRPRQQIDAPYLHLWLTAQSTKHYLREGFVSGSAIPRVVLKDLKRAQLLRPIDPVLETFSRVVEPMRASVRANVGNSETLVALRDALLPKLMSGELRVPDAERIVGKAV